MSNQSPFEIRLELLKMAKEMLEQEYYSEMNAIEVKHQFEIEVANRKGLPLPDRKTIPYPTEAQVIHKAAMLNEFVSKG